MLTSQPTAEFAAPDVTRPAASGRPVSRSNRRRGRSWSAPARMLGFDLIGPLVAYKELRAHSVGTVPALLVASAFPLVGVLLTALRERHVDSLGLTVMVGTGAGAVLSLIINSPRPTLIFTGVLPGFAFAVACLLSVSRRPMIYQIALTYLGGPENGRGVGFARRWDDEPGFRRYFRTVTAGWGVTYLLESAAKTAIVFVSSTGSALALVGTLSFVVFGGLGAWTAIYAHLAQRPSRVR